MTWLNKTHFGDCRTSMRAMIAAGVRVNCIVTSPPYWGLRDYGHPGQLGLEKTPEEYVANMVEVFRLCRDLLADDGVMFLNLGDSYAASGRGGNPTEATSGLQGGQASQQASMVRRAMPATTGLKHKDLVGIPWMVAFALRADGWYLRQDIIWAKPNPMPESVRDRCTKAHEYIFMLSKSAKYYYDAAAIAEPLASASVERLSQPNLENQIGSDRVPGKTNGNMKASWKGSSFDRGKTGEMKHTRGGTVKYDGSDKPYTGESTKDYEAGGAQDASATKARIVDRILSGEISTRNKRSVWTVTTKPFKGAHFATFPPDLIKPCILAGCPPAGKRCDCDVVIDSPLGEGEISDPSMTTGRAGMNRPRRPNEGTRPITRREQRWNAEEMRNSIRREAMKEIAGEAFAHYIRTDTSGARPLPAALRDEFMSKGWITEAPPCDCPVEPPGVVLDPFMGSGTTAQVAQNLGRQYIGCELNPGYESLQQDRTRQMGMAI